MSLSWRMWKKILNTNKTTVVEFETVGKLHTEEFDKLAIGNIDGG